MLQLRLRGLPRAQCVLLDFLQSSLQLLLSLLCLNLVLLFHPQFVLRQLLLHLRLLPLRPGETLILLLLMLPGLNTLLLLLLQLLLLLLLLQLLLLLLSLLLLLLAIISSANSRLATDSSGDGGA